MNLTRFAVENKTLTNFIVFLLVFGGFISYFELGRLEDPDFTVKTAIIITHRIYSMLQFDKIIVLDEHRIVEEGKHESLLAKGGYYAEMFEKQRTGEDSREEDSLQNADRRVQNEEMD